MTQDLTTAPHCQTHPCLPPATSQTLGTPPQGNTEEEIGHWKYSLLGMRFESIMKSGRYLVKCKYMGAPDSEMPYFYITQMLKKN